MRLVPLRTTMHGQLLKVKPGMGYAKPIKVKRGIAKSKKNKEEQDQREKI